jgi:hypothetical protein
MMSMSDLRKAEIEGDKLHQKIEAQLDNLAVGVAVLWLVIEHGLAVVGYLTTEQWEWYEEFVVPKLEAWGEL